MSSWTGSGRVPPRRSTPSTVSWPMTCSLSPSACCGIGGPPRTQAFLELVRASASLRGDGRSLRAWLYRAVRFSCLDELRRRRRRPEVPTDRIPESGRWDPPADGLEPHLERALAALSDRQRALVVLRHVVGLSGEEIAGIVRSNRTAVYAALGRAERRLRALLAEEVTS